MVLPPAPVGEPSGGIFDRFQVFVLNNPRCVNGYKISRNGSDPINYGYSVDSRIYWMAATTSQTIAAVCFDYYMKPSQVGTYRFVINSPINSLQRRVELVSTLFSGSQPVNTNYAKEVNVPVKVANFSALSAYADIKTKYIITGAPVTVTGRVSDKFTVWVPGVENCQPPRQQRSRNKNISVRFVYEYRVKYINGPQYEPISGYASYPYQELICE